MVDVRGVCVLFALLALATPRPTGHAGVQARGIDKNFPFVKLHPNDLAESADFGTSVAVVEGIIVAGAQNDRAETGSIFFYTVDIATNKTSLLLEVSPAELTIGANFGCALASAGSLLFVGAQYDRSNNGSVYVFEVEPSLSRVELVGVLARPSREEVAESRAAPRAPSTRDNVPDYQDPLPRFFGSSLSVSEDGNTLIVGAASGSGSGGAFQFAINQTAKTIAFTRYFTGSSLPPGANFAQSVAVADGGILAIAANHAFNLTGAVVLYLPDESTATIHPSDLPPAAYFGSDLALAPLPTTSEGINLERNPSVAAPTWVLAVSAPWALGGVVYVYSITVPSEEREHGQGHPSHAANQQSAGHLAQTSQDTGAAAPDVTAQTAFNITRIARLSPVSSTPISFGCTVALHNNRLFIGAWLDGGGSVSIYTLDGLNVVLAAKVQPYESGSLFFGSALAVSDDVIVVGADGDFDDQGSAFVFASAAN